MKIFTELYDYIKDGYLRPKFSNKTINYSYELNNKNEAQINSKSKSH